MIDEALTSQIKNFVESAHNILVIYPPQATTEQKAVAASLYLALLRVQKGVRLVTPKMPEKPEEQLVGLENTQIDMGNQNLSISFNYIPEQVDKVSYHIGEETGKFYLTIKPKAGFSPLDANNVEFSYTGASAEVVFLVGVNELESLEQLYFGYEDLYRDVPIISINSYTTSFGTVKLDTGAASTSSEVVAQLIPALGLPLDSDTATNLLFGIESGTNNLTALTVSADTFETVAQLLRAGARRSFKRSSNGASQTSQLSAGSDQQLLDKPREFSVNGNGQSQQRNSKNAQHSQQQNRNNKNNTNRSQKNNKAAPPAEFSPSKRI